MYNKLNNSGFIIDHLDYFKFYFFTNALICPRIYYRYSGEIKENLIYVIEVL